MLIDIKIKDYVHCTCPECGISWLVLKTFSDAKVGKDIYCPNGHPNKAGAIK